MELNNQSIEFIKTLKATGQVSVDIHHMKNSIAAVNNVLLQEHASSDNYIAHVNEYNHWFEEAEDTAKQLELSKLLAQIEALVLELNERCWGKQATPGNH